MDKINTAEIMTAIGELRSDIATLRANDENMSKYIYKDLKPDIEALCDKVEDCMTKAEDCYQRNVKWMAATIVSVIIALFGWGALLIRMVI